MSITLCDIKYQVWVLTSNLKAFFLSSVLAFSYYFDRCLWNVNNKECISMDVLLTRTLPQLVNFLFQYFTGTSSSYFWWAQRFGRGNSKHHKQMPFLGVDCWRTRPKVLTLWAFCTEIIRSRYLTDALCKQEIIFRVLGGVLVLYIIVDGGVYIKCIKEMLSVVKVLHIFLLRFRNEIFLTQLLLLRAYRFIFPKNDTIDISEECSGEWL